MHILVIGLSLFVTLSSAYGDSRILGVALAKANSKAVNQKVNPRIIAEIGYLANSPIEIKEETLKEHQQALISGFSLASAGVLDSSSISVATDRQEIISYMVEGGDTLSSIAKKFNITTNTIKWANGLSDVDSIKPGQKLTILPFIGTIHKVKSSEDLNKIASLYNASIDQVIEENGLLDNKIEEGQVLMIPGGRIWEPTPQPQPQSQARLASNSKSTISGKKVAWGSSGNRFPYGYCTYYVASRRSVTWRGNAGAWLSNARAQGYATGYSPRAGAIIVTNESPVGHVGIVESVSGNSIRITEMNYAGFGRVSSRTISASSGVIKGYIY